MAVAINCRGNLLPEKLHLHKSIKVNKKSYLEDNSFDNKHIDSVLALNLLTRKL